MDRTDLPYLPRKILGVQRKAAMGYVSRYFWQPLMAHLVFANGGTSLPDLKELLNIY